MTSSAIDKMFEIFGPIFEQNVTINFEPIFEPNANFDPIFEKRVYFGPIFEKSVNFEHFVNGKWSHYNDLIFRILKIQVNGQKESTLMKHERISKIKSDPRVKTVTFDIKSEVEI